MPPWDEFAKFIVSLLVIAASIGAIPLFLAITQGLTDKERQRRVRTASIAVAITLIAAIWAGEPLLRLFGISLPAFRVGGGVVILLMAVATLQARRSAIHQTSEEEAEARDKEAVAVAPLAIPMLAGPSAIGTAILAAEASRGPLYTTLPCAAPVQLGIALWLSRRFALPLGRLLGTTVVKIATRIMGLFLAAIAIEFISDGLVELFPVLARRA